MISEAFITLFSLIWLLVMEIAVIGLLWVLRIAIIWWIGIDYVEEVRKLEKNVRKNISNH